MYESLRYKILGWETLAHMQGRWQFEANHIQKDSTDHFPVHHSSCFHGFD